MRLVLYLGGSPVEFNGELEGGALPYLINMTPLRMAARAGYLSGLSTGESPNLTATLGNTAKRVATLIGHPIRCIAAAYDDADNLLLRGPISGVTYGQTVTVTIES